MDLTLFIFIVVIIVQVIIAIIHRYYLPKIKGAKGEYHVSRVLRKLDKREYRVFNDIYLKVNSRSTQIDHLVISIYGIFVIETKNYSGWIHGAEKSEYWTQTFFKNKKKFRNPIKQNWAHIFILKEILQDFSQIDFYPIIVFSGNAELKNVYSNTPVIYKRDLKRLIQGYKTVTLSKDQIDDITDHLTAFMVTDKKRERRHNRYVKKGIQRKRKKIRNRICPSCGGQLVVRKGKYGRFYGCSNYPNCRFSTNI